VENKYAAPHVWNLVAKILRNAARDPQSLSRNALTDLALAFAERFQQDEGFDPLDFLDKCSPDIDLYPLSELWGK
jgi:hypothetical protein